MFSPHRFLCAFSGAAWAERHCAAPQEEDHEGNGNVFDHDEDGGGKNGFDDDDVDSDGDQDGDDTTNSDGGGDGSTENNNDATTAARTTAPSPGPAHYKLPPCVTNAGGQFFVSEEARADIVTGKTALVSFAYQVQGSVDLTVATLRNAVLPHLERALSTVLVPALFAPHACQLTQEQQQALEAQEQAAALPSGSSGRIPNGSSTSSHALDTFSFTTLPNDEEEGTATTMSLAQPPGNNRQRGLQRNNSDNLQDGPVTGMQPIPDDVLLPNLEGVRCRTPLVDEADRCFILKGAFSLSGPKSVDWAVYRAQQATEKVMNEDHALDNAHPLVKHVMYLDAINPDEQPWLFDRDGGPPVLVDPPQSSERVSTTWSLIIVGAVFLLILAIVTAVWRRRRNRNRGSFDDDGPPPDHHERLPCCYGRRHPARVTRGYMAYPSPEPEQKQRVSIWDNSVSLPNDDSPPDYLDSGSWSEEPVSSFDRALGSPMAVSSLSSGPTGSGSPQHQASVGEPIGSLESNISTWQPDGSFPGSGSASYDPPPTESVIDLDDDSDVESFGAFQDDDDDEEVGHGNKWRPQRQPYPSSPNGALIRDLV